MRPTRLTILALLTASAQAAPAAPQVRSLHCVAEHELATYRADYDRDVDSQTLIFQSTSKDGAKKTLAYEMNVARWYFYQGGQLDYAVRARDKAGRWVEFAVTKDGTGREMGNDVWWYTEAVPSQLVKFDCKTVTSAPVAAK